MSSEDGSVDHGENAFVDFHFSPDHAASGDAVTLDWSCDLRGGQRHLMIYNGQREYDACHDAGCQSGARWVIYARQGAQDFRFRLRSDDRVLLERWGQVGVLGAAPPPAAAPADGGDDAKPAADAHTDTKGALISSFAFEKISAVGGTKAKVTWSLTTLAQQGLDAGSGKLLLGPQGGDQIEVPASFGETEVTLPAEAGVATFVLTYQYGDSTASRSAQIGVTADPQALPPRIDFFSVKRPSDTEGRSAIDARPGETLRLLWACSNADDVQLSEGGTTLDASAGSLEVQAHGASYTLTASNPTGRVTATVTVSLATEASDAAGLPVIHQLDYTLGQYQISWSVTGATALEASCNDPGGKMLFLPALDAGATGLKLPVTDGLYGDYAFTLTASSAAGPVSRALTVAVTDPNQSDAPQDIRAGAAAPHVVDFNDQPDSLDAADAEDAAGSGAKISYFNATLEKPDGVVQHPDHVSVRSGGGVYLSWKVWRAATATLNGQKLEVKGSPWVSRMLVHPAFDTGYQFHVSDDSAIGGNDDAVVSVTVFETDEEVSPIAKVSHPEGDTPDGEAAEAETASAGGEEKAGGWVGTTLSLPGTPFKIEVENALPWGTLKGSVEVVFAEAELELSEAEGNSLEVKPTAHEVGGEVAARFALIPPGDGDYTLDFSVGAEASADKFEITLLSFEQGYKFNPGRKTTLAVKAVAYNKEEPEEKGTFKAEWEESFDLEKLGADAGKLASKGTFRSLSLTVKSGLDFTPHWGKLAEEVAKKIGIGVEWELGAVELGLVAGVVELAQGMIRAFDTLEEFKLIDAKKDRACLIWMQGFRDGLRTGVASTSGDYDDEGLSDQFARGSECGAATFEKLFKSFAGKQEVADFIEERGEGAAKDDLRFRLRANQEARLEQLVDKARPQVEPAVRHDLCLAFFKEHLQDSTAMCNQIFESWFCADGSLGNNAQDSQGYWHDFGFITKEKWKQVPGDLSFQYLRQQIGGGGTGRRFIEGYDDPTPENGAKTQGP